MRNHEIKGSLARLLATENLIVEHRKNVPTASFNVDTRVLTLPLWDRASSVVYDLLVGHEVGHALFTPNEDWTEVADCPKDFINVVEDVRIEKLMKRKYPGLRKYFASGYRELNEQDFFAIKGEDLRTFSFIDRINLHFKVGASSLIPFSDNELPFVARAEEIETFEEVCELAVDIYEFSKNEKVAELPEPPQQQGDGNSEQSESEDSPSESDSDRTSDSQDEQPSSTPQNFDGDDDDSEEDEEMPQGSGGGAEQSTQDAFDKAAQKLSSNSPYIRNQKYVEIPDSIDLDKVIVDWKEVHDWIDHRRTENLSEHGWMQESYDAVDERYHQFRKESQKEVNYLVKEFECKKSADAYARSTTSRTGVLDCTKLHTYKYNEDLFKKVSVIPDGKNHGLIFILDWYGSMADVMLPTIKQLMNLTTFCKKVSIPFEVYAFTNEWGIVRRIKGEQIVEPYDKHAGIQEGKLYPDNNYFNLINIISSRSNSRDYERMCINLWREVARFTYHVMYRETEGLSLSGTPLNESIVCLNYIIPKFKNENDLQKVNVCVLTDGDGCMIGYGRKFYDESRDVDKIIASRVDESCTLRDRKTGITYKPFQDGYSEVTNTLIQQVKDRNPNVNIIGYRVLSGSHLQTFVSRYASYSEYEKVQKQWKKEKSAVIPNPVSYSGLYAIQSNALQTESNFDVESGSKKGEISRAFKKMLTNKSTNKKVLQSFVGLIA